jgi:predicted N-acetyltransferase YhbS
VSAIRQLRREDLGAVAALYAELVRRDPRKPAPGFEEFFARTLLDAPSFDPEIPSLVYEAPGDGVVAVLGSHVRPFRNGEGAIRLACCGPLIVRPDYRPKGIGALLLRSYVAGPQELTVNDRVIDVVRPIWSLLGGVTDAAASIGWARTLRPAGYVAEALTLRRLSRNTPLGGAAISRIGPILPGPAESGSSEPLREADLVDLIEGLRRVTPLRPAYDATYFAWLFEMMEQVEFGDMLLRRLVRDDRGCAVGAYVAYVHRHGAADLMQIYGAERNLGAVLDHLLRDAAVAGAVLARGRVETALLPHLRRPGFRLGHGDWVTVHSRHPELLQTVLEGRALISRTDGEWWMRPRAETA